MAPNCCRFSFSVSRREEVAGVEGVVAHEVEQRAVELVGARLGGRVQRAAGLRELGGVGALLDLEFLQRVDRRLDQRSALVVVGDVGAVQHERGLVAADAADGGARDVVGADAQQVAAAGQQHRAGREAGQLVEAAAVQRQVDDLRVGDDVAERAGLAVEQRRGGVDDGALGQRADRELTSARVDWPTCTATASTIAVWNPSRVTVTR